MIERGADYVKCGEFVVLDDVTNGIPPIQDGTPSPVAAWLARA